MTRRTSFRAVKATDATTDVFDITPPIVSRWRDPVVWVSMGIILVSAAAALVGVTA